MTGPGARHAAQRGWLRLFLVLGVTVAALLVIYRHAPSEEAMAVLPYVCAAFVAFLAPIFVSERTGLFSPPGLIGLNGAVATAAMMASILQEGGVRFEVLGIMTQEQRIALAQRAALLILVAHLSYLAGYYRSSGAIAARFFPAVGMRQWQGGRLVLAILVTAVLVVPFYYLFQQRMGGAAVLDVTELGRGKQVIKEDPTMSWMVRGIMFAFVPTLLLASMAILDRSKWLLALTGIVFLLAAVLVTRLGPRQPAFSAGLMILILFNYLWRKVSASLVVVLLLVAVVTVNLLGTYRTGATQDQDPEHVRFGQGVTNPVESMARHEDDRSRLQVLGIVLHYFPEREDYLLGDSYGALSVSWIPRWIWPEKNELFEWQGNRIVQKLTGLPAPVPYYGELYANFSWFGVVIGMALFGAFHRGLARYRESAPKDVGVALIYTVVATQFTPTSMGISATAQYLIPITILIYVVSQRVRTPVTVTGGREPAIV